MSPVQLTSLTSILCKILEHIVCKHLMNHFEKHNILSSLNHGFRSGYSCETQLAVTIHDLVSNLDKGVQTDIAILDFSKAFDTVPHHRLIHKLDSYGVRGNTHRWIKAFLCQRHMRVVVDGESSDEVPVESGVSAIPSDRYFTRIDNKRRIKARTFSDHITPNIVDSASTNNNRCIKTISGKTQIYNNSLFPKQQLLNGTI